MSLRFSSRARSGKVQAKTPIPAPSTGCRRNRRQAARHSAGRAETRYSTGRFGSKLWAIREPSVPADPLRRKPAIARTRIPAAASETRRATEPAAPAPTRTRAPRIRSRNPAREPDAASREQKNRDQGVGTPAARAAKHSAEDQRPGRARRAGPGGLDRSRPSETRPGQPSRTIAVSAGRIPPARESRARRGHGDFPARAPPSARTPGPQGAGPCARDAEEDEGAGCQGGGGEKSAKRLSRIDGPRVGHPVVRLTALPVGP
jgi:hypothetical protein